MKFTALSTLAVAAFGALVATSPTSTTMPTVYLIRHGEKPSDGSVGLSATGVQRSQCLRTVFGNSSQYNISYIMAQQYDSAGNQARPYLTVQPLAADLGLTIDHSCARDDSSCVKNAVSNYKGSGNILICWQHTALSNIAKALGDNNAISYTNNRYGQIGTDVYPYTTITLSDENCPGLSNQASIIESPRGHILVLLAFLSSIILMQVV
ncbi:putative phosphoglycerate mutase family protein [Linnemannia elongata]|nr:putative phosphoglycerate mutase family protein [Linnemannia elongata]